MKNKGKMISLKKDKIYLREATKKNVDELFKWWNDGEVMAHAGFPKGLEIEKDQIINNYLNNTSKNIRMIIEYNTIPIGEMVYKEIKSKEAEIGIKICEKEYRDRGIGKAVLLLLIDYLFLVKEYSKIVLDTGYENKRARYVYEKLGFISVKVDKDSFVNQVGERMSLVYYEFTRNEYLKKNKERFIDLSFFNDGMVFDLKYATEDNFLNKRIYPIDSKPFLRLKTAYKLHNAQIELIKKGYSLKILDAYRPLDVQKIFWNIMPDDRYVANPNTGSKHNRGTAVDVTLVDENQNEIIMPSEFDDFSDRAHRNYNNITDEVKRNLLLLTEVMKSNGFSTINSEWWHYDDLDWKEYGVDNWKL